jgi:1-acyl-sn-glycerol-3-phosphate acyltransferase
VKITPLARLVRGLIRFLLGSLTRIEIRGRENVPASGGFIIAANHLGMVDALIVYYALDSWDLFVPVAEKWEKKTILRFLGRHLNFIFIDRFNPDLRAMREIIRRMKDGQVLVIAPEGTRSRTGALIEGKPGVSYLAARAGFPVVPVAMTGTEDSNFFGSLKRLRRPLMTVTGGKTFSLPPLPAEGRDQALKEYTDEIMCRIAVMLPEKYRGVYAEHPRLKALLAEAP